MNPFFDIIDNKGKDLEGSLFGTAYAGAKEPPEPLVGDCYVTVPCTLIELFNGCKKTIAYDRQILELDGRTLRHRMFNKEIFVKPGYSQFNNLTYKGEGHQQYRQNSTDLIVSFVEAMPDPRDKNFPVLCRYRREGDDLFYRYPITLQSAINCEPIQIPTLDGRTLSISLDEIVTPSSCKKILGEGMPIYKKPRNIQNYLDPIQKGSLFIKFEFIFPRNLTDDQKSRIEAILLRRR